MLEHIYESRTPYSWKLAKHPQGRPVKTLRWDEFFPPELGDKSQREQLREQCQSFLDAWVLKIARSGKPVSSTTVYGQFIRIRIFVRWMIANQIWSFSKLTPQDIEKFFRTLVASKEEGGSGIASGGTLKMYASLLGYLWILRGNIPRAVRFDTRDVVNALRRRLVMEDGDGWRPLEEKVCLELLHDAIHWVEDVAPDVKELIKFIYDRRAAVIAKTKPKRTQILRRIYEEMAETEAYKRVEHCLGSDFETKSLFVRNAYRLTFGAALTVIFGLVGMRSGEVMCLVRECISEDGSSGEKMFHLRSIESKRHRYRNWATTQTVRNAVEAIHWMLPWVESGEQRLLQVFGGNTPVPLLGRKTRPMPQNSIRKLLDQFASSPHRASPLNESVHPHRFRHSFARFVMRRDKRALGALAEHYGHVFRWITDQVYASGRDRSMLLLLEDAELNDMREGYRRLLTAAVVAGKGAAQLEPMRQEVANGRFQGKVSMEEMIEAQIERGILKLAPCSWGYCAYEQSLSACRGTHLRPNDVTRNPALCASCSNFIVTPEHRVFWEERYQQDEEFLKRENIPGQSRRFVESRIEVSGEILRRLI